MFCRERAASFLPVKPQFSVSARKTGPVNGRRRRRRRSQCDLLPVGISSPQQSEAGVSVQFGLTLRPLDGSFETLTEEALKEDQMIRRSDDQSRSSTQTH